MPVKLITATPGGEPLTPTPKKLMDDMIKAYKETLHKLSTDSLRKRFPGRTFPDGSTFCDTHSAWVSSGEINQLIEDNSADGIRIYFGCHDKSTLDPKTGTPEYLAMHNVILVATKSDDTHKGPQSKDQLKEAADDKHANSVIMTTSPYEGNAGDLAPLCPPACPPPPPPPPKS